MNRKQRNRKNKRWAVVLAFKPNILVAYFYAHEKQSSRVNDNRKRARMKLAGVCDNELLSKCADCKHFQACNKALVLIKNHPEHVEIF